MKKLFTKKFMHNNCGCYSPEELEKCSFMAAPEISLESIINSEIPLKDKFWFVCKKVNTRQQNQQLALDVAEIVLPIYEKRYPGDLRIRECIEAAKQYITGHITLEQLLEKRMDAADAAYAADVAAAADAADAAAAAYAAYAAAAAAYAADADADAAAADAAAYAADAAAYAAYAADVAAAADAADAQKQLLNYLINFCNEKSFTS